MIDPLQSLPFCDLTPSWVRHARSKRLSERTIYLYMNAAERLNDWLVAAGQPTDVASITRPMLEDYFIDLQDEVGAYTVGIHYRSLRALFNWFEREEELERSPFYRMSEPKADEQPVPVFTVAELGRLLDATNGTTFEARRDRAILSMFMDSGPRLGELVGLHVEDLDLDRNVMLVDGKSGPRQVPIGAKAAEDIDRYLRARRSHPMKTEPALWLGKRGALTESGIAQLLKRRGEQAGVANVRPHRFRHTFGHQWRMAGGNEGELMTVAGWKSDAMVKRYGRSAAGERAREAHQQFSPRDRLS